MDMIDWTEVRLQRKAEEIVVKIFGADGKTYLKRLTDEEAIDFAHRLLRATATMNDDNEVTVAFVPEEQDFDTEDMADARNYVIWCEGRLKELRQAGLVTGPTTLTETGRAEYTKLIASGFVPVAEKVILTLRADPNMPQELVEKFAALMLS